MIKLILIMLLISYSILAPQRLLAVENKAESVKHQSLDELHSQTMEFLKQKVDQKLIDPQIQLKRLNPRILLPRCLSKLEFSDRTPTKLAGRTTIGISCPNPSWKTFVSAYIDGKLSVVISTKGILKQAVIKPEDVTLETIHYKSVPNDALISLSTVVGMRAKKSIPAHKVLTLRTLQPPYWVFKKQPVSILTKIGSIEVRTKGMALENGVEHQQIDIKNNSSQRVIKGIVVAPNTVLVP